MPINYKNYPSNWKAIRAAILERAQNQCERCGVANGVYRLGDTVSRYAEQVDGTWFAWNHQTDNSTWMDDPTDLPRKPARIVLTIAHIHDPDPANCDPDNLQALCQRCHNRLDAPMRAKNAARTMQAKVRRNIVAEGQTELLL